jgi:formate dehydrogenase subunit gamma
MSVPRLPSRRLCSVAALMLGAALAASLPPDALAQLQPPQLNTPGADLWRSVRQGDAGVTQATGVDQGVLIRDSGELWRTARMRWIIPFGALAMGTVIGLFVLYYFLKGRIRIDKGRSGRSVPRTTRREMWVHWITAFLFLLLMLTGLVLLFGKLIIAPWLGKESFSATAYACKLTHNYAGPAFLVAVVAMFFTFLKEALFNLKVDLKWFLHLGGYLGGPHPSSEKINAGQKAWFWVATGVGIVIALSGLVLAFPDFGQPRVVMQIAHVTHVGAALFTICFFFVHLYLASIGMEGSLESMTTGCVDANWAEQHHDLWYAEVKDKALPERR